MLTQTRLFIIGICIVFLVIRSHQEPKNTTPVNKAEKVENSVNVTDICGDGDPSELRMKTTFESDVWCYQV